MLKYSGLDLLCIRTRPFKRRGESYGQVAWDEDMEESECSTTERHWLSVILCSVPSSNCSQKTNSLFCYAVVCRLCAMQQHRTTL